jgi:putative pyruvate formate lyase activating enzyme
MSGAKLTEYKDLTYLRCNLCPRMCGVDRTTVTGFCGCGSRIKVARAALHYWEEPCISGERGSGTVFFSGCTLRCRYCQNSKISLGGFGKEITPERLARIFLELQDKGAHNINLVTPTQFLLPVIEALDIARPELGIPVVYNCGGYERAETVRALKGYVDIFLPDIKYCSSDLSCRYSLAPDYFEVACCAVSEMVKQSGPPVFGNDGMLRSGVIVRHMVLPGQRHDSMKILEWLAEALPRDGFLISLMSQYTPYAADGDYPELNRRVTTFEYDSVVRRAFELGLTRGYMQEKSSAKEEYTPDFGLEGI